MQRGRINNSEVLFLTISFNRLNCLWCWKKWRKSLGASTISSTHAKMSEIIQLAQVVGLFQKKIVTWKIVSNFLKNIKISKWTVDTTTKYSALWALCYLSAPAKYLSSIGHKTIRDIRTCVFSASPLRWGVKWAHGKCSGNNFSCHNEPVMLRTLDYILRLPSSLFFFFLFYGAVKENFKVTYAGHFNQAGPCVVRRIQQHADIWPQHGGSGAPSCQSHGSGEMSLSLIVLCFSGAAFRVNSIFSVRIRSVTEKKGPIPNLYWPLFDRKHLTACGFTAAPQIKYPSALGLAGCYVSLSLQSLLLLPFFF